MEGDTSSPFGGVFENIGRKQINGARAVSDFSNYMSALQFNFIDGTSSPLMGSGNNCPIDSTMMLLPNRALSSILYEGNANDVYTNSNEYIVFGFMPKTSPVSALNVARAIYVKAQRNDRFLILPSS